MARYMGGPRGQSKPATSGSIASHNSGGGKSTGSDDHQKQATTKRDKTVIPDSDDLASASQGDQGNLANQRQVDSDLQMEDGRDEVGGGSGQGTGMATDSVYDGDESNPIASIEGSSALAQSGAEIKEESSAPGMRPSKRPRAVSIGIHYHPRSGTGRPILQPLPLPIAYGWMARGAEEHLEDLHLSGIPFCDNKVKSKRTIEVLGDYTWIKVTPSQEESYEKYPAVYVPGNTRTWIGLKLGKTLDKADVRSAATPAVRDEHVNRQPRYPYEPTFRALAMTQEDNSFKEIDIVTDVDTLTKLLAFIMGPSSARPVKEHFRLDLASVRNTLFILPAYKPGSSQAGPDPKKARRDPKYAVPEWCADVLGHMGTRAPRLPYSGGHYRVVRYRFGCVVLAVRVKVDFVYEHRKDAKRANTDPLRDVQPEFLPRQDSDVAQAWKTTVREQGIGTMPADAGIASVRYLWQDKMPKLKELFPQLWFSRTPFVIDAQVSYPDFKIKKAALINSRNFYTSFERGHQASLRRLAGLLKYLQRRTRELEGNITLIADPAQVCFVLLKPVVKRPALPEDLAMKFWGPDAEKEAREKAAREKAAREGQEASAAMGRDSTPEEEQSDLSDLSDTPSLPPGSDIANVGVSQPGNSQLSVEEVTSSRIAGGRPTRAQRQRAAGIDPVKMVADWNKSVTKPVRRSGRRRSVRKYLDGAGYETDDDDDDEEEMEEDMWEQDQSDHFDDNMSHAEDGIMVGESAHEPGFEGANAVLNQLLVRMNAPNEQQDAGDEHVEDDAGRSSSRLGPQREAASQDPAAPEITSVLRIQDVEVLRGGHSLLMVDDRNMVRRTRSSDDDDDEDHRYPLGAPIPGLAETIRRNLDANVTHNLDQLSAPRDPEARRPAGTGLDGAFLPSAPTPLGPSDFGEEGGVIDRRVINRNQSEAQSADGNKVPTRPHHQRMRRRTPPWERRPRLWDRPPQRYVEVIEIEDDSSSSGNEGDVDDDDDDGEEGTIIEIAGDDSDQSDAIADGASSQESRFQSPGSDSDE
ncbi:hypothetical protein diail_5274 [Diaporthe ilicicola]|nr:hypothetical protein diail_5274 [Diaporthe ilicicola]